jgi:hypothetical protein
VLNWIAAALIPVACLAGGLSLRAQRRARLRAYARSLRPALDIFPDELRAMAVDRVRRGDHRMGSVLVASAGPAGWAWLTIEPVLAGGDPGEVNVQFAAGYQASRRAALRYTRRLVMEARTRQGRPA